MFISFKIDISFNGIYWSNVLSFQLLYIIIHIVCERHVLHDQWLTIAAYSFQALVAISYYKMLKNTESQNHFFSIRNNPWYHNHTFFYYITTAICFLVEMRFETVISVHWKAFLDKYLSSLWYLFVHLIKLIL